MASTSANESLSVLAPPLRFRGMTGGEPVSESEKLALRESERRYRRFFEEDISGDFLATPGGSILECNPAYARMLGFDSVAEARSCPLQALHPEPGEQERLVELLRRERKLLGIEAELRRRDGTPLHVIMNVVGIFDARDELVEIQGYLVDVTQHKQVEEQLRHSQKMEAVGRLAGGIAHDFNNFLTVIQGNVEMALADLPASAPLREDLEEIKSASGRAAVLVRQLLTFSRRNAAQPKVVLDLRGEIANLDKMLRRLIGEHIELVTRCEPGLGHVRADAGQIEQVIVNLVVNARDAMPDGGRLVIEACNRTLAEAEVRYANHLRPGRYVEIRITDSGCGMDEETLSRIFEPFFTTKEKRKGTGLGLPTAYGIIKQSGGYLWAESAPGRGSTFRIYLPIVEGSASSAQVGAASGAAHPGSETILVVEDEDAVRSLARRALERSGYHVLDASDGGEAMRISEDHEGTIHLLLTDLTLCKLNGRELAQRAAALRPGMKVLYTSGYADEMAASDNAARPPAFLQKPFTPEQLTTRVREVLSRSLLTP
jgi:PAS domain S-box-containing protein